MAERPRLRWRAIALYEERGQKGAVVVACSLAAARQGIAMGLTLAEARGGAASGLYVERHDPLADRLALEKLAGWCQQFSPTVGLEDASQPESLLLDVTGLDRLYGNEEALVRRLRRSLAGHRWHVRLGLADTLGAAWAVAHFGQAASAIVSPGEVWTALRPLPVAALRLPDDTLRLLGELGIERIEQLESLPREALAAHLGPQVAPRLSQAGGALAEPIMPYRRPPAATAACALESPAECAAVLDSALEILLAQIVRSLDERQQGILRLECWLALTDGPPMLLSVGMFRASNSLRHVLDLLRLRRERLTLSAPVSAVRLEVTAVAPLACRQRVLPFASGNGDTDASLAVAALVDRLSSRLGRECVLRATLEPDAEPECACRYAPVIEATSQAGPRRAKAPVAPTGWWRRPLRLTPQPVPLETVWAVHDGPPNRFVLRGREHRVRRAWGPERIETGWWRRRTARRDYYRVECDGGGWHWLFRRLEDGRWFWQGAFE